MRMFSRGDVLRSPIPQFAGKNAAEFPTDEDVSWTFYSVQLPDVSFDEFTYRQLRASYWSAYAADSYWVRFPSSQP